MGRRTSLTPVAAPVKTGPRTSGRTEREMGLRIRVRRVELQLSQSDLAKLLGVSFQQIQKYEKGVNRIGPGRLEQLAAALGAPVSFFFGGTSKVREVESLISKDASYNIRLLRAYAAIGDPAVQRRFVSLMEKVAGIVGDKE